MMNINQNLERIINEIESLKSELQAQRNDINEITKAIAILSERTDRNFDTLSARIDSTSSRIDGVNTRIDNLCNGLYLWLVVIGTFIAFVGVVLAWPKVKDFLTAQKTTLTIQDVERLIDAKLNARSQ